MTLGDIIIRGTGNKSEYVQVTTYYQQNQSLQQWGRSTDPQ